MGRRVSQPLSVAEGYFEDGDFGYPEMIAAKLDAEKCLRSNE